MDEAGNIFGCKHPFLYKRKEDIMYAYDTLFF